VAYVYLDAPPPAAAQLGGQAAEAVCRRIDWVLACRLPE
jgi:hypothetical protein